MANTLNLGNGNWATKEDSLLAYNSENGNFKPLPFDFTRASSATVVNKAGLIETVGSGEPRIDYKDDIKGALKLEPTRSNLITYSEQFDNAYWTKSNLSVISGFNSPDGTLNADKLVENTSTGSHQVYRLSANSNTTYSISIFAKKGERDKFRINIGNDTHYADFNLSNGTIINQIGATTTSTIDLISNGWYRCSISYTESTGAPTYNLYRLLDNNGNASYQGDGTSGIYIYGAQLEVGSYATSYIPTSGGVVTRNQDSCIQTVPSGVIGQTEGTVLVEFINKINYESGGYNMLFTIYESSSQLMYVAKRNPTGIEINAGTGAYIYIPSGIFDVEGKTYKMAIGYKQDDFVVYINGVQIWSESSGTIPFSNANNFSLGSYYNQSLNFNSKIKEAKLYNTRLSNAELQALTTL